MHRLLCALLFCLTAGAAFAQMAPSSADASAGAPTTHAPFETTNQDSTGSDRRWNAADGFMVSVTESVWKSSVVHANLASAPSREAVVDSVGRTCRTRCAHPQPAHLLHIPLLI